MVPGEGWYAKTGSQIEKQLLICASYKSKLKLNPHIPKVCRVLHYKQWTHSAGVGNETQY